MSGVSRNATAAWLDSRAAGDGPQADIPAPAQYVTCPVEGRAVRLTRSNPPAVVRWIGANGGRAVLHPGGVAILAGPGKPPRIASEGDWVVLIGGSFITVPAEAYRWLFRNERRALGTNWGQTGRDQTGRDRTKCDV